MSENRGHGGASFCGVEHLVIDLTEEQIGVLKLLLWNWARMTAGKYHGDSFVTKQLLQPMISVMQKGVEGRQFQ